MRIMAVDYGDARTGVAVSDLLCSIVGSTTVIHSRNPDKTLAELARLAKEREVSQLVVGLPKNMDGTEGARAQLCREFAQRLEEATGLPVALWDERRTTVEAHNILSQHNYHGKKRKDTVDALAASLIQEGYLAFRGRYSRSCIQIIRTSPPKILPSRELSRFCPHRENSRAATHPAAMPGNARDRERQWFLRLQQEAIRLLGRKNSRLVVLAVG